MNAFNRTTDQPAKSQGYTLDYLLGLSAKELREVDPDLLQKMPPVELAHVIDRLGLDQRREILRMVSDDMATEILSEMDIEASAEVVEAMRERRAVKFLEDLDPDDATDVVAELEEDKREDLLSKMEPESAQEIKELLVYDPDTAGGTMTPDVCCTHDYYQVDEAIRAIRQQTSELESIYYVYVVDESEKLVGVVSLRDLMMATPDTAVASIMKSKMLGVLTPETDRERAAYLMAEFNFIALPVVDEDNRLLGIVTHDDVIDILQAEATEDIQKLVGAGADESVHDLMTNSLKKRHIWLQVNLLTVSLAAGVVSFFEEQIASVTFLAVFMPVIAATGGNTGAQTLAVVIRSLALGDIRDAEKVKLTIKELFKGFLNGIGVGLVGAILVYLIKRDLTISLVVWVAMVLTMAISGFCGAFIPLILKKMGWDPAQSSSIFLTTITDIAGFFIFLSLGSWLLL